MRPDLPSGTVTFLFTDVEGSTRLLHELGATAYAEALAQHRRVIRDACGAAGGIEVDTQGDAFFFAFPTAPGATAAASAMTDALAEGPIQVRIGLHTGTPLLTDEGYIGDDVHFAARVGATGHGGQVVMSTSTAALVTGELVELGKHRLKDIEDAVQLFQLGAANFPPLKTISNSNLPRPASSFLGRERELAEVLTRMEGGPRLLTFTGPGGTGKTRLALEAASSLVGSYRAGVFWVGLAPVRDASLVAGTIAQAIGAKDGLASHIGEREMLLVLDNFEHIVESAPELSAVLQACPNLAMMATSRELLRIQGEVEYAVPPLAEAEAVTLFCERAQLEPSPDVAELCRRLDSLPLAVELAAARTKALTPARILERLSQRLDLLKGGRDADPRQQTLRATIEWSHDLLGSEEQELFARLSVFAGGCTLEAAEAVADADLDVLQSLVEKSLVRHANDRYTMLETIREFASEQLGPGSSELRRRHADYYLGVATRTDAELRGDHDNELLDALGREHNNVRAALTWSVEGDPAVGVRIAAAMSRFWWMRGHSPEAGRWLEELLAARDRLPNDVLALGLAEAAAMATDTAHWEDVRTKGEEALALARELGDDDNAYKALTALAEAFDNTDDAAGARGAYEQAREIAIAQGNRFRQAACTYNLGVSVRMTGDLAAARTLMEEALVLAREIGTQEGIASSLMGIGSILREEGALDEALATLRHALTDLVAVGFPVRTSVAMVEIADVYALMGETSRAALLLGAAESVVEAAGVDVDDLADELEPKLLSVLGQVTFDEVIAEGRRLTLDEAVALANDDQRSA